MNNETMVLGTGIILLGLYNTYVVPADAPVGNVNKIVLLSTGALVIGHARDGDSLFQTIENVAKGMVSVNGV